MIPIKKDTNYGHLNFFTIEESGLYKIQKKTGNEIKSECLGLETKTIFKELKKWVDARLFKETSPWTILPKDNTENQTMCYCKEIHECTNGDFIVTLWKHDPSDTGSYRGLRLNEKGEPVGFISNNSTDSGDDVVWGHPCYYWIIPEHEIVASIKFEDSKCDSDLMQKWVNYCVRYRLKIKDYNRRSPNEKSTTIFFSTPSAPEDYSSLYRFSKKIKEFKTSEEHLNKICEQTKHILIRNEVTASANAANSPSADITSLETANKEIFHLFQKIMGKFFGNKSTNNSEHDTRRVEVKIEATPSIEQVKDLMKYADDFAEDGWADIVFIDSEDNKTSIKKHRLVKRITLKKTGEVYSGQELFDIIKEERSNYLESIIKKQEQTQESTATNEQPSIAI